MPQSRPNILFLMTDQMQAQVLRPGHPCQTPNLDRLAARGVRFDRAYTPNAICSPARASLMTGLLPHNHGVLTVTHCVDEDQSCLREDKTHWAQRLEEAGYRTGYFGKWHVERTGQLERFGWQTYAEGRDSPLVSDYRRRKGFDNAPPPHIGQTFEISLPAGYPEYRLHGVTDEPPERRFAGLMSGVAGEFLDEALEGDQPWCCFVSVIEPHDPFIAGREAFRRYDVENLPLPPSADDDLTDKPNLYRKVARVFSEMGEKEKRDAAACYYAMITEVDALFGELIDKVERAGQADNTIFVFTTDHGELLGAHGLYCKNVGAFEEVYNIPLILAGPGIAGGEVSQARVGLHDLCPTLLELAGIDSPPPVPDSRSFTPAAHDPQAADADFTTGYAEYNGTRYMFTQRSAWDGPWKLVHNGFDFDELYNLDEDPHEMRNLAALPQYQIVLQRMMALLWRRIRDTGEHTLLNTAYPPMRAAPFGPQTAEPPRHP